MPRLKLNTVRKDQSLIADVQPFDVKISPHHRITAGSKLPSTRPVKGQWSPLLPPSFCLILGTKIVQIRGAPDCDAHERASADVGK